MKNYFKALAEIFRFNQKIFKKNGLLFALLFIPFLFIDHRLINIDWLDAYDVDEFFFLKILHARQYYGFNHLDAQKFFSGFYSYGRLFWVINFLVSYLPFAFKNYNLALFLTRAVSSLFAIQGLLIFKETLLRLAGKSTAVFFTVVSVLMTYFWAAGSWLHPDWMMMYFVLLAFYYFFNPPSAQSKAFLIALGLAVAVKVQSLQFMPLLALYYAKPFFAAPSLKTFWAAVRDNLIALLVIAAVFVLLNPYLLHPKGPGLFMESFAKDMASNKNNNQAGYLPTFGNKLLVFAEAYLSPWIVVLTVGCLIVYSIKSLKNFTLNFDRYAFILATILVVFYYILFVNKAWPHYYLPIPFMLLLVLAFTLPAVIINNKHLQVGLTVVVLLQLINGALHINYFEDWAWPERRLKASHAGELYRQTVNKLNTYPDIKTASVVFTYDLPIPVNACRLDFDKVYHSPELNLPELEHISRLDPQPADYVVVQKSAFYQNQPLVPKPDYQTSAALIDSIRTGKVHDLKISDTTRDFIFIRRIAPPPAVK